MKADGDIKRKSLRGGEEAEHTNSMLQGHPISLIKNTHRDLQK